jgi:hypothetical protein
VLVELGVLQRGKIAFAWDESVLVGLHRAAPGVNHETNLRIQRREKCENLR